MRRSAIAGGLLAVGAALALAAPEAQAGRRKELRENAKEDQAITEAQKHYSFGYRFYTQGLLSKAEEQLRQALDVEPDYQEALYVLGLVRLELNDYRQAIDLFQKCLVANPYFTEAHNLLGTTYAKMGDYQAAMREFEAVKADINFPTPEVAHYNIGRVFAETGNCGEALLHFRRALEINPEHGWAWFMLGDCHEQLGQLPEAREALQRAVDELDGASCDPHYRLGYVCYVMRDVACARQNFDRVRLACASSELGRGAREFIRQLDFR